jgi:hypothetical protein
MSNEYVIVNGELMHYGVPGMRWGHRKAQQYTNNINRNRNTASVWQQKADAAAAKGKTNKAAKLAAKAEKFNAKADKYQNKVNARAEKAYKKVGKLKGEADYQREQGQKAYDEHDRSAKVLDKVAKQQESKGNYLRAEAARRSAEALRARGKNIQDSYNKTADGYLKRSGKLNAKVSDLAKASSVNLGKKRVESIINSSADKQKVNAKARDDFAREAALERRLGTDNYNRLNAIRGRS